MDRTSWSIGQKPPGEGGVFTPAGTSCTDSLKLMTRKRRSSLAGGWELPGEGVVAFWGRSVCLVTMTGPEENVQI